MQIKILKGTKLFLMANNRFKPLTVVGKRTGLFGGEYILFKEHKKIGVKELGKTLFFTPTLKGIK